MCDILAYFAIELRSRLRSVCDRFAMCFFFRCDQVAIVLWFLRYFASFCDHFAIRVVIEGAIVLWSGCDSCAIVLWSFCDRFAIWNLFLRIVIYRIFIVTLSLGVFFCCDSCAIDVRSMCDTLWRDIIANRSQNVAFLSQICGTPIAKRSQNDRKIIAKRS